MGRFAAKTTVPVEKTRSEIEAVLQRYGSTGFAYARNDMTSMCQVEFIANERRIRFLLPLPKRDEVSANKFDQGCRQRWRALLLAIKAKLEAVESGISEFESEFLANIVNPFNNKTVYEEAKPQIAIGYDKKKPQALLLTAE